MHNLSQSSLHRSFSSKHYLEGVSITTNDKGHFQVFYPTTQKDSQCPTVEKLVPPNVLTECETEKVTSVHHKKKANYSMFNDKQESASKSKSSEKLQTVNKPKGVDKENKSKSPPQSLRFAKDYVSPYSQRTKNQ